MNKGQNYNLFSGKLPKNLDAEIDPERWLPRRERSYYRGKKKDKRRDIGKTRTILNGQNSFGQFKKVIELC